MNDEQRLAEFIGIVDNMAGDAASIIAPHIDIESLTLVAQARAFSAMQCQLTSNLVDTKHLHNMMTAIYMDGFAHGCGWAKLKQGSGEK